MDLFSRLSLLVRVRHSIVRLILIALVPACCLRCAADDARPPNIVLIVSDDQGYNDLGVLNDELISPNLDRLVNEGVRLTSFYVATPCASSPSSLSNTSQQS